jgi:1,4-alpha-glucan branching enzyme
VPAHFPRDGHGLRRFDGTALYEHEDPRQGEHPDWGTMIFNYGRNEVRNFLVASALYWLREFHVDGLRVDAVASMLYRDYGRQDSDWLPNVHGGRENLEAVHFLRELNDAVHAECPGAFTVAEESTAWPGVTRATRDGGLGFDLKWNMGWMHDTLGYFAREPVHRSHHQNDLTFASVYEHTEQFLMPLSHDEVVHGKRSLLGRMPGDDWQRFANLRLLYGYQYTRPGKQLLFMGSELAPEREWAFREELEWGLAEQPLRAGLGRYLEQLGALYLDRPAFWRGDPDPEGFAWIDCSDHAQSVVSYLRRSEGALAMVVLNLTPVPRPHYRIGSPHAGDWRLLLSSDDASFGGSGAPIAPGPKSEPIAMHGFADSIALDLPPLACVILEPAT